MNHWYEGDDSWFAGDGLLLEDDHLKCVGAAGDKVYFRWVAHGQEEIRTVVEELSAIYASTA